VSVSGRRNEVDGRMDLWEGKIFMPLLEQAFVFKKMNADDA